MIKTNQPPGIFGKYAKFTRFFLLFLVTVLYCYAAWSSFGYDDEYYNIRVVTENKLGELIRLIQSTDIHPPLSYIINCILFKIFHGWNYVRMVSAVFFIFSLLYVVYKTKDQNEKLLIILLLGFNPTLLLWATSLRWYAYATPILLILSVLPGYKNKFYWTWFFSCFLVLFFLGYIGFILFIPYFIFYWLNDRNGFKKKAVRVLIPGALFALAYARQLYIFFTVHRKTDLADNQQLFDLKTSLISVISSDFSNQGVFPLSFWGIISMTGTAVILLSAVIYFRETNEKKHWMVFAVSTVLFVVTGIAGKIRNLVLLEPSRNLFILSSVSIRKKIPVLIGLLLLLAGNMAGVYHVLIHRQTTKNAWNIPLAETLKKCNELESPLAKEIYFTHSPTFTYHLAVNNKNVISFYNSLYFDSSRIKTSIKNLIPDSAGNKNFTFILTYRGKSIPVEHYNEMIQAMNSIQYDSVARIHLGLDKDYKVKQQFFPDYPKYDVEIIKFYGIKNGFQGLSAWERGK